MSRHGPPNKEDLCPQKVFDLQLMVRSKIITKPALLTCGALSLSWSTYHPTPLAWEDSGLLLLTCHSLQRWHRGPCQLLPSCGSARIFFIIRVPSTGTETLHSWRYSNAMWTYSWATCCRWPSLEKGVGPNNLQQSFPTSAALWFWKIKELYRPVLYQTRTS